jgi:hypothetical protein
MILYADTATCGNSTHRIASDILQAGQKNLYTGHMNLPEGAGESAMRCARAGVRRRGGKFGWRAYFAHRAGAGLPVQLLSIYVASQTRLIGGETGQARKTQLLLSKVSIFLILITF